jgi:uncharacterized protein YcbK (DUF882 family)
MGDISRHFNRSEFACKCGCGYDTVDAELLTILESVRDAFGQPVSINSASRCEEHNKRVGGSKNSQHLLGRAADIVVRNTSPIEVHNYVKLMYPLSLGLGSYENFTHIDTRTGKARW